MSLPPGCGSGRWGWGHSGTSRPGGFIPAGLGSLGGCQRFGAFLMKPVRQKQRLEARLSLGTPPRPLPWTESGGGRAVLLCWGCGEAGGWTGRQSRGRGGATGRSVPEPRSRTAASCLLGSCCPRS